MAHVSHVRISASEQRKPLPTPQKPLSDMGLDSEDDLSDGIDSYGIVTNRSSSDHHVQKFLSKLVNLLISSFVMNMRGAWLGLEKA